MRHTLKYHRVTLAAWGLEALMHFFSLLPAWLGRKVVRFLGGLAVFIPKKEKKGIAYNTERLLNYSPSAQKKIIPRIYKNFAETLYDFLFPDNITFEIEEQSALEALRRKHGGILILTFHIGNWELGAHAMKKMGWPVTAVYQPHPNRQFRRVIERRIRVEGVNYLPVGQRAATGVREALRRGDYVAMLGDFTYGESGTPVDLLGKKVLWPRGPVVLAVRERAPIVLAGIIRIGPRTYHPYIEEPIIPQNGTQAEVERLIQVVAHKFGRFLERYPEQWYRFEKMTFVE